MSSKIPKTGIASRLRVWMSGRGQKFTLLHIWAALLIPAGKEHERAYKALQDFIQRGEVVPLGPDRRTKPPTEYYAYNPAWHKVNKGVLGRRIYKAMYVAGQFAVTDIMRLAGAPKRSHVDKIIKRLKNGGYLQAVGSRPCAHGAGAETIYHVADRDRFSLEVMG